MWASSEAALRDSSPHKAVLYVPSAAAMPQNHPHDQHGAAPATSPPTGCLQTTEMFPAHLSKLTGLQTQTFTTTGVTFASCRKLTLPHFTGCPGPTGAAATPAPPPP